MNEAFIDGQNLIFGTKKAKNAWNIDLQRFLIYLQNKYKVIKAYYFIGYNDASHRELYEYISSCGYELIFREHNPKYYAFLNRKEVRRKIGKKNAGPA